MIRQPFNLAVGRTRAEASRVTDGIAATLRAFSAAQQLAAPPQDSSFNNNIISDGGNSRPTGRQRAADAFNDLVKMDDGRTSQSSNRSSTVFRKLDLRSESAPITVPSASQGGSPNVIRGGLRGGFRGRGGSNFSPRGGAMSRGGGMNRGGRGTGVGGTAGATGAARRGNRRRSDGGGEGGQARGSGRGRGRGKGGRKDRDEQGPDEREQDSPEVKAWREAKEIGSTYQFDPSISMSDLAGWGPAVATAGSSFAKGETALRQVRVLGSGQPFHPLNTLQTDEMWERYNEGSGVFFPTQEMKKWSADVMKLEEFPPVSKETRDAVLQDTLLGTYQGPEYTDRTDTLGAVRNYIKRDSSWNADVERRVVEKVRSLLPGGRTGPAKTAGGASARA
ncbi:hypothetical protein HD806DRAFT_534253 [Xylariaceae sp. AK1471]|nr:hypothetical protein HD806DRAFT_534253 [Xylariaceae sp. AK1471]